MSKDFVLPPRRRFTIQEKRRNAEVEWARSAWASEHGLRMVHKLEGARRGDALVGGSFSFGRVGGWFDFLTSLPIRCSASGVRHTADDARALRYHACFRGNVLMMEKAAAMGDAWMMARVFFHATHSDKEKFQLARASAEKEGC